jgi:hypothetical protein
MGTFLKQVASRVTRNEFDDRFWHTSTGLGSSASLVTRGRQSSMKRLIRKETDARRFTI